MTEYESQTLFDKAAVLAYQTFADPDDMHIMEMYSHVIWLWQHGLDDGGVCLVH